MAGKNNWDGDLHLTSDTIVLDIKKFQSKNLLRPLLDVTKAALEKVAKKNPNPSIKEALRAMTRDPIQYKIRWVVSKKGKTPPRASTTRDQLNWPAVEIRQEGRPDRYVIGDAERANELRTWLARVSEPLRGDVPPTLPVRVIARTNKEALYEIYIFVDPAASTLDEAQREKEESPFIRWLKDFEYGREREYPTFSPTTLISERERLEGMVSLAKEDIKSAVRRGEAIERPEDDTNVLHPSVIAFLLEPSEDQRPGSLSMFEINVDDARSPSIDDGGAKRLGNWAILGTLKKSRRSPNTHSQPLIAFWYSQGDDEEAEEAEDELLFEQQKAIRNGQKVIVNRWNGTRPPPEGPVATAPADLQRVRELKQAYLNFRDALRRIKSKLGYDIGHFFRAVNEASFLIKCELDEAYENLYKFAVLFAEDPNEVVYHTARTLIRCLRSTSAASVRDVVKSSRTQLKMLSQTTPRVALEDYPFEDRKRVRKKPLPDPAVVNHRRAVSLLADSGELRKQLNSLEQARAAALQQDPRGHEPLWRAMRNIDTTSPPEDTPIVNIDREIKEIAGKLERNNAELKEILPPSLFF